jgi:hypothetical protein
MIQTNTTPTLPPKQHSTCDIQPTIRWSTKYRARPTSSMSWAILSWLTPDVKPRRLRRTYKIR